MKPRNRMDSVTAAVGDAASLLRRRRTGRQPRVRCYDADGIVHTLDPESPAAQALVAAAAAMVDAADARGGAGDEA